jgi:hypothetical protein
MALETTGFNIQGAMPDLSQGYALGGLKPLSFSGGGQSPVAIAPLAGWKVESAHPEQVMQGLGAGLGAIAKGISAAYISKNAEDTRVIERGEDIDLKKAEMANQSAIAEMHAKTTEASQAETARHNRAMEEDKQNIIDRGGRLGKSALAPRSLYSTTPHSQDESQSTDENPTFFGNDPETKYLENQYDISTEGKPIGMKKMDDSQSNILANLGTDIFSKKGDVVAAGPYAGGGVSSDTGSRSAINTPSSNAISDQDASRIFAKYNTSNTNFGIPVSAPLSALEGLKNDEIAKHMIAADVAEQKQFGMLPNQKAQIPEQALAEAVNIDASYSEPEAIALRNYARLHGIPEPKLKSTSHGMEVHWKDGLTPLQTQKQKNFDQRLAYGVSNTLEKEPKTFESEDNVKNYMGQRGLMQMLVRLSPSYEASMKDPEHTAIPQLGMAQLMAQAETGGVPTVSAVEEYLHSQGITDTLEQMKAKYIAGGKEVLTPRQTTQIYELLLEEAKAQASLANQTVRAWQDTYKGRGVKTPEKYISPFILPKTKAEANQEINDMIPEIAKAKAKRDKLEKSGDAEAFAAADKEWRDMSKHAIDLKTKVDKTMGHIVNYHDILNTRQGFLAPVPINELSKDAFEFMKSNEMSNLNPAEQQFYMGGSSAKPSDDSE